MVKNIYDNIKPGRPAKFPTPQDMWNRACDYFKWAESKYFKEDKLASDCGSPKVVQVNKMRAFTQEGLCLFIGLDTETFRRYGTGENGAGAFKEVVGLIKMVIREQQFTGAAADLLNANLISKALGLHEKTITENHNFNSVPLSKDEIKTIENELENEF
jgi:hypothetical protein